MPQDDWLRTLTLAHTLGLARQDPEGRRHFLEVLGSLERALEGPSEKRAFDTLRGLSGFHQAFPLSAGERQRVERLSERLWKATGSGRTSAEEALLGQVGALADPESLPFWCAALEANRERDVFQPRRRRIAVASVGVLAQQGGHPAAHAQLGAWLTHPDVTVRTEAVDVYAQVHLGEGGGLRPEALATLQRMAREERAFAPRFLARGWLYAAGAQVPVEPPDGVYAFKASLGRVSRTVELRSSHSLDALASAILDAFGWDHDHLYEFALTGDLRERRFVLPDEEWEPPGFFTGADELADVLPGEESPSAMDLPLGAFGFPRGHTLLFRYDFGDDHRFRVAVADIQEQRARRVKYPRVVARTGKAPEQYRRYE